MEKQPTEKRPQWKTTLMEDDLYGIQPQFKDKLNERQTQQKINEGAPQQQTTSREDNINGR